MDSAGRMTLIMLLHGSGPNSRITANEPGTKMVKAVLTSKRLPETQALKPVSTAIPAFINTPHRLDPQTQC